MRSWSLFFFTTCIVTLMLNDASAETQRSKVLKRRKIPDITDVAAAPENHQNGTSRVVVRKAKDRNGRFLSLFTIVRFRNDLCPTTSGQNGTCYTQTECTNRGGQVEGSCAGGFGVCCFFNFHCGRSTSENSTYFMSPPSPLRICNLMINRMHNDICQIRVDFELFELAPPDIKGQCTIDSMIVTGGSPVPSLCGSNSGQHILYTVTPDSGPSQISIITDTTGGAVQTTFSRNWRFRIHQYECTSPVLAPSGCLQYYREASGQFKSFNYKVEAPANFGPNHLANLNYAICFRIENGFCGMRYSQVESDIYSFTITGDASTTSFTKLDVAQVKYSDSACSIDYIHIPGGSKSGEYLDTQYSKDRFCGLTLGYCGAANAASTSCVATIGPVISYTRPFVVRVVTSTNEEDTSAGTLTDKSNRGFNLLYSQLPCSAIG